MEPRSLEVQVCQFQNLCLLHTGAGIHGFYKRNVWQNCTRLTEDQKRQVEELLQENKEVFSTSEFDLGRTNLVRHTIDTGTNRLFKQPLRRHPMAYLPMIDEHVDKMLANDICKPLLWFMGFQCRTCKNVWWIFKILHRLQTIKQSDSDRQLPLPRIDTCFDALGDAKFFSTLDLRQGYWPVETIQTHRQDNFLSLEKVPSNSKCYHLDSLTRLLYFNDWWIWWWEVWHGKRVWCFSMTLWWCRKLLNNICNDYEQRLGDWDPQILKLKPSKCKLFQLKVKFLGSLVFGEWLSRIQTSWSDFGMASSEESHGTESFCWTCKLLPTTSRRFLRSCQTTLGTDEEDQPFIWGFDQQQTFEILKNRLMNYPVLASPLPDGRFIIDTDASDFAMGAVLQQEQHGSKRVILMPVKLLMQQSVSTARQEKTRCSYIRTENVQILCSRNWKIFVENRSRSSHFTVSFSSSNTATRSILKLFGLITISKYNIVLE